MLASRFAFAVEEFISRENAILVNISVVIGAQGIGACARSWRVNWTHRFDVS
ncbi:hypothetical protein G3V64_23020, partial [Escherichia coli]|nr:hypothetical protein [Escherichia coli]